MTIKVKDFTDNELDVQLIHLRSIAPVQERKKKKKRMLKTVPNDAVQAALAEARLLVERNNKNA